jgi:hypothetical protein
MEKIRKLRLFQRQEYISLDYSRQDVAVFHLRHRPEGGIPEIASQTHNPEKTEPLKEELSAFLRATRNPETVECSGEDGRRALVLALDILSQAERAQAAEIDRV